MTDDARVDAGPAAYRGFLFSDMRGFTAFGERYGNAAAAAMVSRFLDLARKAIARHEGAEIKTEGDAIHAVFPSASGAVLCGLDIVDAAAELNAQEPERKLGLGVGIHAGEAVETAEGYIGRAVNIAARLCSVARPGEVLVSSTVKGITQASISVGFIPRGRRRLKGIQDPILVYAVSRDPNAKGPREVPRPVLVGAAGAAVIAVAAIAALVGSQLATSPLASAAAKSTPTAQRIVIGPLPIGTYRSVRFLPPVTFDIREPGWTANGDAESMLSLVRDAAPRGGVQFLRVQEVSESPCGPGSETPQPTLGAGDVLAKLQKLTHLSVSEPQTVRVGGYVGRQVDVTVSDGALAACGGLVGGGVALFNTGAEVWQAASGEVFRLIAVTVGDQPVTILLSTEWTSTPSVQELQDLLQRGQQILDSAKF
jgi:class 3 adenylate cyclase